MYPEHGNLTWILSLLLLSGVLSNEWKVEYQPSVCAVKGSSVVIPCSFYYPKGEKVQEVKWGQESKDIYKGHFIFDSASNNQSSRFQYIGDKLQNCSLKINPVEHNIADKYIFRFITKSPTGQWTGTGGSTLKIVDLKTSVTNTSGHGATKEGDSVNVTCRNSCDGGDVSSAFIWLKNGESIHKGPSLYWRDISPSNSGNYTCSLEAHNGTTSRVVNINVEYGPKNTSVSVRPSTEVDVGSNVILTCSSRANPPVENYSWFKVDEDDVIIVENKSELHFREFSLAAGGRYLCSATNKHGSQNSTMVTLKVKAHFPYISIIASAAAALLIVAAVVIAVRSLCFRFNEKRAREPEADHVGDQQNTVYLNWPIPDNSNEGNPCEGEQIETVYTNIDFNTKRKSDMQQQMDSHSNDEGAIYSMLQFPGSYS
ncbi:B-cell receptor CD22-like isoform X1 [Hippoglossus hippoglossus]|uniref:B-cell receptor CD22-like isoform X1 n=1 Tax=Hippoglossus hippoglossus TaxID=8267 RepID=UPI00148B6481|nr:B-cell receptor CD22-like isoform X1 [Hippoglossus hippoglossus]